MFKVEMLPAREGDCFWISYGDPESPSHILVDGGRMATAPSIREKIQSLPEGRRHIELVVVTHVDRDHIEGMLEVLEAGLWGATVGDLWFNGFHHLTPDLERMGAIQGERLTAAIDSAGLPWNLAFGGGPVAVPFGAPATVPPLPGGMRITLLSPTPDKLATLEPVWIAECGRAGLVPGEPPQPEPLPDGIESFGRLDVERLAGTQFDADRAAANGSSIALLLEYDERRLLLAADAHADVLIASLRALAGGGRLRVDAFKVPHHGSARNLPSELLDILECGRYLVSTNGSYFNHPEPAAIARILRFGGQAPEIVFNYRSDETARWDVEALRRRYACRLTYPEEGADGYRSVLL
jgi:hypothetical protein